MKKKTATKILKKSRHCNIVEISMDPGVFVDLHVHEWDVDLIILKGSLQVNVDFNTKVLTPGDRYKLKKNIQHSEYSGVDGVTFLTARPI